MRVVPQKTRTRRVEEIKKALALLKIWSPPFGKKGWERAYKQCVKELAKADSAGDTERFKQLSQAKQVFRRRMGLNWCFDCGATINGSADRCGACSREPRVKRLGTEGKSVSKTKRKGGTKRPFPPRLASLGYWAAPVRPVIDRWENEIGADWCELYVIRAFRAVLYEGDAINIPLISPGHKAAVIELLAAFNHIATAPRYRLDKALLMFSDSGSADYSGEGVRPYPDRYPELLKRINFATGGNFSLALLKKRMAQLKLNKETDAEDSDEIGK